MTTSKLWEGFEFLEVGGLDEASKVLVVDDKSRTTSRNKSFADDSSRASRFEGNVDSGVRI